MEETELHVKPSAVVAVVVKGPGSGAGGIPVLVLAVERGWQQRVSELVLTTDVGQVCTLSLIHI